MNPERFCQILDQIQQSIFKKLDKYGTNRRVDESAARDAVGKTIDAAKIHFKNYFGKGDHDKTTRSH